MSMKSIYDVKDGSLYNTYTHAEGPKGKLPFSEEFLRESPSGHLFGMTLNAGMGWNPEKLNDDDVLILSNQGGIRGEDGSTIAVGLHTGHFELGLQMRAAADEFAHHGAIPYAAYVTDPCDGRSQGTTGMFDSLPYRNDAAIVLRRLARSLPTRKAVMGIATCDKGLPAMMMALASMHDFPTVLVPGGATLHPEKGEDAGTVQTIGVRFASGEISFEEAAKVGCSACASAGGGCQFFGTAGTSQVIAEALGLAITHSALSPSGQPIWEDIARASARAVMQLKEKGITTKDIITDKAIENAMVLLGFNRKFCAARGSPSRGILHGEPLNYPRAKFLIAQEERNCGELGYGFSICHYRLFSRKIPSF